MLKDDVTPSPSDPANAQGGSWMLEATTEKSTVASQFLLCVLALVGEQFDVADELNGAVLSLRMRGCRISVWTKGAPSPKESQTTLRQLSEFLDCKPASIQFQLHADASSSQPKKSTSLKSLFAF